MLLGFCFKFCQFQAVVADKSVAYKKSLRLIENLETFVSGHTLNEFRKSLL